MKIKIILGFIATLVMMCLLCTFVQSIREERARSTFAQKICDNLIHAGYLQEAECMISNSMYEVFTNNFPEGTDINYVLAGMEGFKKLSDTTSRGPNCMTVRRIRFMVIPGLFIFRWSENVIFSFCDDILGDISWES